MTPKIKAEKLLSHLKSKIKKLFGRNCILDNFMTRKCELHGVFLWTKDPDLGDSKTLDLNGSGSATLVFTL